MELFVIYLWLKLEAIQGLFLFLAFVLTVSTLVVSIYYAVEHNEFMPHFKKLIGSIIICVLTITAIPSKQDVAILVGTHYALKLTDTPEAGKVMTLLRKKANDLLDEEINSTNKKEK